MRRAIVALNRAFIARMLVGQCIIEIFRKLAMSEVEIVCGSEADKQSQGELHHLLILFYYYKV